MKLFFCNTIKKEVLIEDGIPASLYNSASLLLCFPWYQGEGDATVYVFGVYRVII